MKSISQILFDSVGTRKQSFESLAEVTGNRSDKYKISKYCAIGAVGCENKYIKIILKSNYWDGRANYEVKGQDQERKILQDAGVPLKIIKQDFRKWISHEAMKSIAIKDDWILRDPMPLDTLIMTLNDSCKWKFEEIAKEIQYLEERNKIIYEEKK